MQFRLIMPLPKLLLPCYSTNAFSVVGSLYTLLSEPMSDLFAFVCMFEPVWWNLELVWCVWTCKHCVLCSGMYMDDGLAEMCMLYELWCECWKDLWYWSLNWYIYLSHVHHQIKGKYMTTYSRLKMSLTNKIKMSQKLHNYIEATVSSQ